MPTNCQTEISDSAVSAYSSRPSHGAKSALQAHRVEQARGDAPERRQDQLPGEADDHEAEDRGDEDRRAVERGEPQARRGEQRREQDADRVLHQHMDQEEPGVVAERVPEARRPARIAEEGAEVAEARRTLRPLDAAEEREVQRREQRHDHDRGVDRDRGRQEHQDMPAERLASALGSGIGRTSPGVQCRIGLAPAVEPGSGASPWRRHGRARARSVNADQRPRNRRCAPFAAGLRAPARLTSPAACTSSPGPPAGGRRPPRGSRCRGSRWRWRSRSRSRGSACPATGSGRSSGSCSRRCRASRRTPAPAGPRARPRASISGKKPGSALA